MAEMPRGLYALPVSFGARSLLALLWSFAGSDSFVWPSRRKLAEMIGVDPRSLRRMLRSLEEVGALQEGREWRGGYVRAGWWLVAAPADGEAGDSDSTEGELGDEGQGEAQGGLEVTEADEGDVAEEERDVVGVGGLGEGEVGRGAEDEAEDRAVRRRGPGGPGREGVQRTRASEEEDRHVQRRGPSSPRERTVRSSRRNQEPARTNHEPSARDRDGRGEHERRHGEGDEESDVDDELRALARWRTKGGDPEGLGPWPEAVTLNGVTLPRLAFRRKELRERLGEGRTAMEVHRAVHGFAELVRAGVLAVENWRAPYCFAGFFDGLVVAVRQLDAQRQAELRREADRQAQLRSHSNESGERELTADVMAAAYAASDSLQSMVPRAKETPPFPRSPSLHQAVEPAGGDLVSVRIRVRAVADLLGRDPGDVLRALGRASMRHVEREDANRIDRVFVALRDGAAIEEIAGWWDEGHPPRRHVHEPRI